MTAAIVRWADKARDALATGMAAYTLFELLRPQPAVGEDAERATVALAAARPAEVARPPVSWWASASEPEREAMRAALREALGRAAGRLHALNARIRAERMSLSLHRRELTLTASAARSPADAPESVEVWHRYQVLLHEARLQHLRSLARRLQGAGRVGGAPAGARKQA